MDWKIIDREIDNEILLYAGYNPDVPLRAWSVIIPNNKKTMVSVLVSSDEDGLDTPENLAKEEGAVVAINGGYFTRGQSPVHHVGLLKSNGILIEPASRSVIREDTF